jgi:hypothetical protein
MPMYGNRSQSTSAFSRRPFAFFFPTCRRSGDQVKKQQPAFFACYAREAREMLNDLIEEYATDGELQFTLPDVLKLPSMCSPV